MAFTFKVEDGTGFTDSNSYVTVAYADDYFDVDRSFEATWDALTTDEKQDRLGWASRILDQKVVWKGAKYTQTQAMAWPRSGTFDRHGYGIDADEIPEQLLQATCEFAKYITTNDPTVGTGVDYLRKIELDVLSVEYMDGTSQSSFPNLLNSILRGIGHYTVPGYTAFGTIAKT